MKEKKDLFTVHNIDARKIDKIIKGEIVDVTITSPPYFNLKDYGYDEQIGFGQTYQKYLEDLKLVFKKIYRCTKPNGSLWVIIDTFREDGEVKTLPFDFSAKLSSVGWKLKDIIIWEKDRTVPWAHKGQMRSIFEYILVFSKNDEFNFFIDEVRDFQSLKKWWVKYPERYNPKGKAPDGIWKYDIPTQGSWGNGYIRHFCPLPEDLIERILKLTTKEGFVVLDPFSGSGAVLSKADSMNRKYIGTELNPEYIKMFTDYIKNTAAEKKEDYNFTQTNRLSITDFENLIIELRALKYSRLIFYIIKKIKKIKYVKIWVVLSAELPQKKHSLKKVEYHILYPNKNLFSTEDISAVDYIVKLNIEKAPLSKFGIEPVFKYYTDIESFKAGIPDDIYKYTIKETHKFHSYINKNEIKINQNEILSNIRVNLNEKDYE